MLQRWSRWFFLIVTFPMVTTASQGQSTAPAKTAPDYSQEAVVVEQLSTKIVFEGDGTSKQDSITRIRMQSDAGVQQFGVLNIPYAKANGDVEIVYVQVRKPDGSVVVTPEENVQEMPATITREAPFYSDLREKHVTVRGLAVGDTLEFQVRSTLTKPQVPGQFWYEHNFLKDAITRDETIEISVPKDKYVKVKSPEVQPSVREEGGYRIYTWKTANLEVKPKDVKKRQQKTAEGGTLPPSVEITTFRSWEEIGRWYDGLQRERIAVTPEIRTKALEITKGLTNDNDKLQAIYRYVASQFRYVGLAFGIGRFQPHPASDVLANGYGDCKDKHTLFAALASAVGIEVLPALVNASRKIDPEMPSPSQFNHLISVVQQGKDTVWLDTTSELGPFGLLTANVRDKEALVLFRNKPPALVRTPVNPPFPTLLTFETEGKLGTDGVLHARITRDARGDMELLLRLAYRRTPRSQWQELTQQLSYMSNFAGTVSNIDVSSPEDTTHPFHVAYDYLRKDYPDWGNRRINPPIPPLLPALGDDDKWSEDEFLGAPGEIVYRAKVELPKGYNAFKLASVDLKSDFAKYHASYESKAETLVVERRLTILHARIKQSEWESYRKFCKQVANDRDAMVDVYNAHPGPALNKPETAAQGKEGTEKKTETKPEETQAGKLLEKARQAIQSQNWQAAQEYMQQVVAIDEKYPGAWLTLGGLASMYNRRDEAIEDFQKEIQFHPDEIVAYRALAEYQVRLQRNKDALETYRRWEKAAPNDDEVVRSIGQFLLGEKQYPEAIGYLERAAQNDPENATVQLLLGTAYLGGGNHEKGVVRLAKATELDPSPNMLNNVAYSLGDARIDIPKALGYGKKAVAAVEEQTQKTGLSDLKMSDLNRMGFLAAYWDTVGWIYFQSNDLENAGAYLKPAWALSQDGTEGDHLAQVYEKKGDFRGALQTYKMALERGADRPDTQQRAEKVLEKVPPEHPKLVKKAGAVQNLPVIADELSRMRTTRVGRVPGVKNGSAEFFILLKDGGTVEAVKFISGKEELRAADKAIMATHFDQPLPPGSQAKIVRRGILSCSEYTKGCDFVMLTLEMVRSLK